jgi:hypothetical protein
MRRRIPRVRALLKGGSKVPKKEPGKKPGEVTQDEALTRRMAIKRIAAGLAGAGIVVVAGMIRPEQPLRSDEIGQRYGDAVKLPYGDKAPK